MQTASEAAVELDGVSKHFRIKEGATLKEFFPAFLGRRAWSAPFAALSDVSFSVRQGEAVGIIGRNGNGKSTILKLIAGVTAPSQGEVRVRGRVCPLIELGTGFHPDLTGRENVFLNASILGMRGQEAHERFEEIVDFAELRAFLDTPVKHYSSGMYLRLAFAIAVNCDPQILLVDEALAVGDAAFQEKCFERMRSFRDRGVTVIFVSHALDLVESFCDRVLILDGGRLVADGNPAPTIARYREMVGHVHPPAH